MELSHFKLQELPTVTVLRLTGRVDASNYLQLIDKAKELFGEGTEYLVLDLEECDFLSSAGLFALHSIALLAHKVLPFDPEFGWDALHRIGNEDREFKKFFKIVNVQPNILRILDKAGFLSVLDVQSDIQAALASFKLPT